ncbi:phenazine biosynthesis protein PhzF family [Priestia flexa]|nr:phenazine biosynthesis protein PhzF family [Priestia flexa]
MSDSKNDGGYDVRIFTPNEEVPFAGHPTLGTAYIIQNKVLEEPLTELILNFKGGQIPVSFNNEEEVLWMKQNEPTFGQILDTNKMALYQNMFLTKSRSRIESILHCTPIKCVAYSTPDCE